MKITLESASDGEDPSIVVDCFEQGSSIRLTIGEQEVWISHKDWLRIAAVVHAQQEMDKPSPIPLMNAPLTFFPWLPR